MCDRNPDGREFDCTNVRKVQDLKFRSAADINGAYPEVSVRRDPESGRGHSIVFDVFHPSGQVRYYPGPEDLRNLGHALLKIAPPPKVPPAEVAPARPPVTVYTLL